MFFPRRQILFFIIKKNRIDAIFRTNNRPLGNTVSDYMNFFRVGEKLCKPFLFCLANFGVETLVIFLRTPADNADAKMETLTELFDAAPAGNEWIGYNRFFESNIRRTGDFS